VTSKSESPRSSRLDRRSIRRARQRISYNAASRFCGRALGGAITLVALHLSTKYFGPQHWGPIVTALAFVTIFSSLSDFGISNLISRELSRAKDAPDELFGAGLLTSLMTALALTIVAAAVGALAFNGRPETRLLVFLLLPTIPLTALFAVVSAVFVARSRNDIRAVFDVLSSALVLVGVFVIVSHHDSMSAYALLQSAAAAAMALVAVAVVSVYCWPSFHLAMRRVAATATQAAPLGIYQMVNVFYGQLDTLLVAAFLSTAMVAWFGLASQIAGFFWSIPGMVTVAATPHFMRKSDVERLRLAQRLMDALAGAGVLLALGGVFFSKEALLVVGGNSFLGATNALRILVSASSVGFLTSTVGMILFLVSQQRSLIRISLVILTANVACNLVAIPLFGIGGAAVALLVSELVGLIYSLVVLNKTVGYVFTFRWLTLCVVLACLVGVIYELLRLWVHLPDTGPWVLVEATVVVLVYGSALEVLRRRKSPAPLGG